MVSEPDAPRILSEDEATSVAYEFAVLTEAIRETQQLRAVLRDRLLMYMGEQSLGFITADSGAGVTLQRQVRAGRKTYDVASMPPALVLAANSFSILRVDAAATKHVTPSVLDEMERYATLGESTYALTVKHAPPAGDPLP